MNEGDAINRCSCPKRDRDNPHDKQGERIAKVIARAGLGSRREAEAWIAAGRVAVNGTAIASPALNVSPRDRITVDGRPCPAAPARGCSSITSRADW